MKILVLLESPGKIKKISQILRGMKDGNIYKVMASMGHISSIANTGKFKIGVDFDTYEEDLILTPDKKKVVAEIKKEVKDSDMVYLASDGDREGNAIAYSWVKFLSIPKLKYKRIIFNEITEKGVKDGIKNMTDDLDMDSVNAARTRSVLDKMVGFRLSPVTRSKIGAPSAGRVQSAVLKILAEKELEIKAFIPRDFYILQLKVRKNKENYIAEYKGTSKSKKVEFDKEMELYDKVVRTLNQGEYKIDSVTSKSRTVKTKPPFTTSTFQQDASSRLGMSPKKSMSVAQKLYESGKITYMRSDSLRLSDDFLLECEDYIIDNFGEKYFQKYYYKTKEGVQDAHEAIRPTSMELNPSLASIDLNADELKVYRLIYNRTVAALMSPAKMKDTLVKIVNLDHIFHLKGSVVEFEGFLKMYNYADRETKLPTFKQDEIVKGTPHIVKKTTTPPNRYSEASIIKKMEELGIGRPSTYTSTVETLKSRNYVNIVNKAIVVQDIGIQVSNMLSEHFTKIVDSRFTSNMESTLDEIAEGKKDRVTELKTFYEDLDKITNLAIENAKYIKRQVEETDMTCPECEEGTVVIRNGNKGQFYACSRYPKCKYTASLNPVNETENKPQPVKTDVLCPKCQENHIVKRTGRGNSIFYACSGFPKCKNILTKEEVVKYNLE